jgi:hypothetical protein
MDPYHFERRMCIKVKSPIRIRIKVKSLILIYIKVKSRIRIRIKVNAGAVKAQNGARESLNPLRPTTTFFDMEPRRVCQQIVADLHHFDEEQNPDLYQSERSDPQQSEKRDPDPLHSFSDPQHC